jgi:hypothetical protein
VSGSLLPGWNATCVAITIQYLKERKLTSTPARLAFHLRFCFPLGGFNNVTVTKSSRNCPRSRFPCSFVHEEDRHLRLLNGWHDWQRLFNIGLTLPVYSRLLRNQPPLGFLKFSTVTIFSPNVCQRTIANFDDFSTATTVVQICSFENRPQQGRHGHLP